LDYRDEGMAGSTVSRVGYPEADYATRAKIAKAHENWQRGLIWTLQHHPRVPQAIRDAYAEWGLPADEFKGNNHWPYELYVREARRMVSDYVMTEKNCTGMVVADDSAGLAAYTMDSHNCQRIVLGGVVKNEGDVQKRTPKPFPISYRSLVPKIAECKNLLTPWSVSSTHVAFASVRMEPVFMILGQSAGTAACIAIDDHCAVQNVSYAKLKAQLIKDGQFLTPDTTSTPNNPTNQWIVIDNADASSVVINGSWTASQATHGFYGADYLTTSNNRNGPKSVRFSPKLPANGNYEVFIRWTANPNRASNVPVDVISASGTITTKVNQQKQNGEWVSLGVHPFSGQAQEGVLIRTNDTNGYIIADAVQFVLKSGSAASLVPARSGPEAAKLDPKGPCQFVQKLKAGVPQRIVGFGTSLTAGGPASWLTSFNAELNVAFPGLVTVINSGGSGMTSQWGVKNVQVKVIDQKPDAVFIEFTTNDSTARFNMSLEQSRANLETIIDQIKTALPHCEIILQIMNPVIDRPEGHAGWRPFLARYQQIYRDVAAQKGYKVIDHTPAWQAVLDKGVDVYHTYVPDGLHPNNLGYQTWVTPVTLKSIGVNR
jgi:lysophospholipase L1-like esterase